jgi:hypothetical protein
MADAPNTETTAPTGETITTPVAPAKPVAPTAPVTETASVTTEGEPNGLPPQAPGVSQQPVDAVIALREWFHTHISNSVHSQDTQHYNSIFQHIEAAIAKIQSKYPLSKET